MHNVTCLYLKLYSYFKYSQILLGSWTSTESCSNHHTLAQEYLKFMYNLWNLSLNTNGKNCSSVFMLIYRLNNLISTIFTFASAFFLLRILIVNHINTRDCYNSYDFKISIQCLHNLPDYLKISVLKQCLTESFGLKESFWISGL